MKTKNTLLAASILAAGILPTIADARGGGGGSGGGGGGGGHGGGGGTFLPYPYSLIEYGIWILFVIGIMYAGRQEQKRRAAKIALIEAKRKLAEEHDGVWNQKLLREHIGHVFMVFQDSWMKFDVKTLESILTPDFYKRIFLELTVLQNEHRMNRMSNIRLCSMTIVGLTDEVNDSLDTFDVEIVAGALDEIVDIRTNKTLFSDSSTFTETWTFFRNGSTWRLGAIRQATENAQSLIPKIQEFASANSFYYNPDFGWLMMPNEGVLFSRSSFDKTDINNHIVGYYQGKVVEFYTMQFLNSNNRVDDQYLIGQAILPIQYKNILIKRDTFFGSWRTPKGLRKHELESDAFNKEFDVYAHPSDNIAAFELLHPAFMEYIMGLPFRLSIEVVGNVLYFYTKDILKADYPKLLEILSRAFEELER